MCLCEEIGRVALLGVAKAYQLAASIDRYGVESAATG